VSRVEAFFGGRKEQRRHLDVGGQDDEKELEDTRSGTRTQTVDNVHCDEGAEIENLPPDKRAAWEKSGLCGEGEVLRFG
jgi:hypothetical protein